MLSRSGHRVLLVGEAPGHKGCAITGIPFTSGAVFQRFDHPLLVALKDRIHLPKVAAENTATMVWEYLSGKGVTPLFWNSFPFHPHKPGEPDSNRPPTPGEISVGSGFLEQIAALYCPETIAAIGKQGLKGLQQAFPKESPVCIRHPSNGGKRAFIAGMDDIF